MSIRPSALLDLRVPVLASLPVFMVACAATGFDVEGRVPADSVSPDTGDDGDTWTQPDTAIDTGGREDTRVPDVSRPDAERPDTSRPDTYTPRPDGGRPDTYTPRPDGGRPDGGRPDGGRPDTGTDTPGTRVRIPFRAPNMSRIDCDAPDLSSVEMFFCGVTLNCEVESICYGESLEACRQESVEYAVEQWGGTTVSEACPPVIMDLRECFLEGARDDCDYYYRGCEPMFDELYAICPELMER